MNKVLKWLLIILTGLAATAVIIYYSGRTVVESEIEKEIATLLEKANIQYDSLNIDLIKNQISINGPRMAIDNKEEAGNELKWKLSDIQLSGFNYNDYLKDKTIRLDSLTLNEPKITYYKNDSLDYQNYNNQFKFHSNSEVYIENILIKNGSMDIISSVSDSLISHASEMNLKVFKVTLKDSLSEKPLEYKKIKLEAKNVLYMLGAYEQLCVSELKTDLESVKLKDISVRTKYPKQDYYQILEKERDWYHATVDSLSISKVELIDKDAFTHYKLNNVQVYEPNIQILRNKSLPDDYSQKPLYSKVLRELDYSFHTDSITIHKGSVTYNEKVGGSSNMAELTFSDLNGTLQNFATNTSDKTKIKLDGKFMGATSIDIVWEFDVADPKDDFLFRANIGRIDAARFNQFIEPQINAVLSGELKKTYFTISGTDNISNIDMKLNYDDFKITVFKKNSREKNKFLSGLANLFIKKTTDREEDNFRETSKSGIRRDQTKSFFNFLWLNIREGLIIAMIGDAGQ